MPTGKTSSASRDGTRGSKRRAGKSRDSTAPRAKSQAPTAQKKGGGKRGGVGRRASQHQVAGGEEEGKKNRASFRGQSQSCHQCRQSIHSNKGVSEVKSGRERIKCSTCTRFWCEQCLLNRYGIVKATVATETWVCPVCCKKCNCSLCRRKEGKLATGILTPLAKVAGFGSVSDFLSDGTDDIARILQWQSPRQPPGKSTKGDRKGENASSSKQPLGGSTEGGVKGGNGSSSKQSRKRKREVEVPLTPTPPPTPPTPPSSHPHSTSDCSASLSVSSVSCDGVTACDNLDSDDINCLSNRRRRPRIQYETSGHVFPENGLNKESVGEGPVIDVPMTPSDDPGSVSVETALSPLHSPPTPISTSSSSSVSSTTTEVPCSFNSDPSIHEESDVHVFVWKSPRRRLAPERFTSSDFRESKGRQGVKSRGNSCQGASERVEYCEKERLLKREELEALRRRQLDTFRCHQKQLEQEEHLRKGEQRKQDREKKAKLKKFSQEIAQHSQENKKGQSSSVRAQRMEELEKLKQERMEWRRQLKDMSFLLLSSAPLVEDDAHDACNEQGLTPLPDIPPLVLPIATQLVSRLLSVAEFLATFSQVLQLKIEPSADSLATCLSSADGPVHIYQQLLRFVVPQEDDMRLKFKRCGQQWEKLAEEHLYGLGHAVNGIEKKRETDDIMTTSLPDYRLTLLELLINEAVGKSAIVSEMETAMSAVEQARLEGRLKKKARTKSISTDLRGLETVADIELKKREIIEELSLIQRQIHEKQYRSMLLLRNSCLGEDRLGRKYWRFQCVPGLVVEQIDCHGNDGDVHDSNVKWLHINTRSLLATFMACLNSRGCKESVLLSHLHNLQHIITRSLIMNDRISYTLL